MTSRLALGLLLCSGVAAAQLPPKLQPLPSVAAAAVAAARAELPATAEISASALDPRLRLPGCEGPLIGDPPSLRGAQARVAVRCAQPHWTVYVPLEVRDLRPVVVLARSGQRGDTLGAADLQLQTRDITRLPFGHFESLDAVIGQELRRAVSAGSPLGPNDAQPARRVLRGSPVTVVALAGGIEFTASGIALADGAEGQRLRVRNERSGRVIEGVVTADGKVRMP
jgi:flagellar basal body P-ring formation protein FlgA